MEATERYILYHIQFLHVVIVLLGYPDNHSLIGAKLRLSIKPSLSEANGLNS